VYIPKDFQVDDPATLIDFMRRYSFATLVTNGEAGLTASHIPVVVIENDGRLPTLFAHVAKANPQWRNLDGNTEVLFIFQGPHGYVSPSLYGVQPSVPTWIYTAVHAYGTPVVVEDEDEARRHVFTLVEQYESGAEHPWVLNLPPEYTSRMLRQIVPFRVELTRVEGKFKLSQNRDQSDRDSVTAAFEASADPRLRELGRFMRSSPSSPTSHLTNASPLAASR
jgi:transcriptional regulator